MLSSINTEQKVYVLEHMYGKRKGYTCLGFNYAYLRAQQVAFFAGVNPPQESNIGTAQGYAEYAEIMSAGAEYAAHTSKRCNAELTPQLLGLEGQRVEIVDSYDEKRRFIVGKSTGWMPCHLEIKKSNSTGGVSVSGAPFKSVRVIK